MHRHRPTAFALALAVVVLVLTFAATAQAARNPTSNERHGMRVAAARDTGAPLACTRLYGVRVSTHGNARTRWSRAAVVIQARKGCPSVQSHTALYRFRSGIGWRIWTFGHSPDYFECEPDARRPIPMAVIADLGLKCWSDLES